MAATESATMTTQLPVPDSRKILTPEEAEELFERQRQEALERARKVKEGLVQIQEAEKPFGSNDGYMMPNKDGTISIGRDGIWDVKKQEDGTYRISAVFDVDSVDENMRLVPKFVEGVELLEGSVGVGFSKTATWNMAPDLEKRGVLITAVVPECAVFPPGGLVYLTHVNDKVSWTWSSVECGSSDVPQGSLWQFWSVFTLQNSVDL